MHIIRKFGFNKSYVQIYVQLLHSDICELHVYISTLLNIIDFRPSYMWTIKFPGLKDGDAFKMMIDVMLENQKSLYNVIRFSSKCTKC